MTNPKHEPDVDWDYDAGRGICHVAVSSEWTALLVFEQFAGSLDLVEVTLAHTGYASATEKADWVTARSFAIADEQPVRPGGDPIQPLTADLLRSLPLGALRESSIAAIASTGSHLGPMAPVSARGARVTRITTEHLAGVARNFLAKGSRHGALAEQYGVSEATTRDWIKRARNEGLLTSPGKGRRGRSTLTPRAEEILNGEH